MERQLEQPAPSQHKLEEMAILEGLPAEVLQDIAEKLYRRQFSASELIYAEDSLGDVMYLIEDGEVRIGSDVGLERQVLATLGPGEHFGETALVEDSRHYAWARAYTDVTVWALFKSDFDRLVAAYPSIYANLSKSINRRLSEADQVVEEDFAPTPFSLQEFIKKNWEAYPPSGYLAMLRILLGALFITTSFENLQKGLYGQGFQSFVEGWAAGNPIGPYRELLQNVVIPNWEIFATVQLIVEPVVMGAFLMIGLFTPASAMVAAFFIGNLFVASLGKEWPWTYLVILGVLITLIASRAGRYFGIDQMLAERFPNPRIPLW
ncbi:MAG: Cyclic AMP receptor protein [Anaerolineales bacterium]|nr:Cyclic AMP receptor protein [Anaerolineales bacterium]